LDFPLTVFGGGLRIPFPLFANLSFIASTVFAEKKFARVFMDVNSYGTIFIDRIRERNWFGLVHDNEDSDVYYYPNLVTQFYTHIDTSTIDHDLHTFIVHFNSGDFVVNISTIEMVTQISSSTI